MRNVRDDAPLVKAPDKKDDQYVTIPIPKVTLQQFGVTHLLVIALVVAAYFLGLLQAKVQMYEKNGSPTTTTAQAAAAPTTAAGAGGAPTVAPGQKVNVASGHLPAEGDGNAKVTIVEFADFRCPFCEQVFKDVEPQLKKDYIDTGKVKLYFRHYAFLGPASTLAANASECANDQGKFWDMHDYLYKNQPDESDTSMYTVDNLTSIAGQLGMDTGAFHDCLNTNKFDANVTKDMTEGQAAGTSATPTFYVDGYQLVGAQPYSAFKTLIDQELAKK